MNTVVTLTPKGEKMFQVIVCLSKSMVELKDYLRVNPRGLLLSESELEYAKQHGLDGLIANGLVAVNEVDMPKMPDSSEVKSTPVSVQVKNEPTRLNRGQTRKMREAVKPPSMSEVSESVIGHEPPQEIEKPADMIISDTPKAEE